MHEIITFENVNFSYDNDDVLSDINFKINSNDFVGIIGPNGGGKTTLLKLILGIEKPNSGKIVIDKLFRKKVGFLPQYSELDEDFPISVFQVVAMGLFQNSSFFPKIGQTKKIEKALKDVSLYEFKNKNFGALSGGQKQRCLLARAIVSQPKLLILDEPTASVDNQVEADIYEMLHQLNKNMTILLVSHDLGFISSYVNRVFCVNKFLVHHYTDEVSLSQMTNETYKNKVKMVCHHCHL